MIGDYKWINGELKKVTFEDLSINSKINLMVSRGHNKCKSLKNTRKIIDNFIKLNSSNYLYFITFTFKKEYNSKNYLNWNRKEFTNYLRRNELSKFCNFILYCDFGFEYDRFHLHGVCASSIELDVKNNVYFNKFGFTKLIKLNSSNSDYVVKYSVKFNDNNINFRVLKVNNFKN